MDPMGGRHGTQRSRFALCFILYTMIHPCNVVNCDQLHNGGQTTKNMNAVLQTNTALDESSGNLVSPTNTNNNILLYTIVL